jgi:hypothetical protein
MIALIYASCEVLLGCILELPMPSAPPNKDKGAKCMLEKLESSLQD